MREFFYGWRRKAGVVTLVMSLALMAGWIRSTVAYDEFRVTIGTYRPFLLSQESRIWWGRWVDHSRRAPAYGWRNLAHRDPDPFARRPGGSVTYSAIPSRMPYGVLVLPLTLLSACLLLSKSRRSPKPSTEG
jgi:hypothetical protein